MVTDKQIRRLRMYFNNGCTLSLAASKSDISEKTARKYLNTAKFPSELKPVRTWRTRSDPFSEIWSEVVDELSINPGLETKTIFDYLQKKYPGKFQDGQLRTLQNKIKQWRALEGKGKEVIFPQLHEPGRLCQSDFTSMNDLGITIQGQKFDHMIYHFVLTYSNWEIGNICYSESFESLSDGLQSALFFLGGVPEYHQSDNLSAAVNNLSNLEEFTESYKALCRHYGLNPKKIQPGKANENGDIEQRHYRFKKALEQALMLRGYSDFESKEDYHKFLMQLFRKLNSGRTEKLAEEIKNLKKLPPHRLNAEKRIKVKVTSASTITIQKNIYSVHSRLIGEWVEARIKSEEIEIWYAQKLIEKLPRLKGSGKHRINYRHIIDSLIRKPGALENYRYKSDMFPSSRFRMAYDQISSKEYLEILHLAAKESESLVNEALRVLLTNEEKPSAQRVKEIISLPLPKVTDVFVQDVELSQYDSLLEVTYG